MFLEKHRLISLPPAVYARFNVDEEKCIGCSRCVKTCPIQLLMMDNKKPRPNERYDHFRCITCQNCMAVCTEKAITIEGDYRVDKGFWKNEDLFETGKTLPDPLDYSKNIKFEEYEKELTDTEKVIYKRRSTRLYKKQQVPPKLVKRVIEAGRFAPSAGNNQPWKFVAIQNQDVINEINEKCHTALKFASYLGLPHAWINKKTPGDKKARLTIWQKALLYLLVKYIYKGDADPRARGGVNAVTSDPDFDTTFGAPTLIIILADRRAIGGTELDLGICAQNMILAAHSLGLATCYIGLIDQALRFHPKFKKRLGIAEPFEIITSFTLGYPKGEIDNIVKREKARIIWI